MTKDEFLSELKLRLKKIPELECEEIIADYEEHFQHAQYEGKEEQEILAALGHPRKLAKELLADFYIEQAKETNSYSSIVRAAFTTIGLGFFNLLFVLGPFLAVVGVILSWGTISISLLFTPILALGSIIWVQDWILVLFAFFIAITLTGLGLLLGVGVIRFTQVFFRWFLSYLQSNLRIIRGVQKNE